MYGHEKAGGDRTRSLGSVRVGRHPSGAPGTQPLMG
jgi:hypothetical protein